MCNKIVEKLMKTAEEYCRKNSLRFTAGRKESLRIVGLSDKAVKAYTILKGMNDKKLMPPIVYRALDFWVKHGFLHKIESLNAYVPCSHPSPGQSCHFMICSKCCRVFEVCSYDMHGEVENLAAEHHFLVQQTVLEIHGICCDCLNEE